MHPSPSGRHPSRPIVLAPFTLTAPLVLLLLLVSWPVSAQQPLPIRELAYSAKFLCGSGTDGTVSDTSLPPEAREMTVIEVHNPHSTAVTITIKWILDYPTQQIAIPPYQVTLASNGALNLDCEDLEAAGCPPVCGTAFRGFVEIRTPQQLKVVALYKEVMGGPYLPVSVSIAKSPCAPFFFAPFVRHAGAFLIGDDVSPEGDIVRHETTIALTNMSNAPVSATVKIASSAGPLTNFIRLLGPNGFAKVTGADLPPATPLPFVGSVMVEYNDVGLGALLACEEVIQKHLLGGPRYASMAMSVVEVQPIPLR